MPRLNEGDLLIEAVRIPSAALEGAVPTFTQVEQILKTFPEVRTVYSKTGRPEIANDVMGVHQTDVWTLLKPQDEWRPGLTRDALIEEMDRAALRERAGGQVRLQPADRDADQRAGGGGQERRGRPALRPRPRRAPPEGGRDRARPGAAPGARDVRTPTSGRLPTLRISVRRDQLARYGIDAADVLDAVAALGGTTVGTVFEGQVRHPDPGPPARVLARATPSGSARSAIVDPQGRPIPLRDLADVAFEEGPSEVERENVQRRAVVGGQRPRPRHRPLRRRGAGGDRGPGRAAARLPDPLGGAVRAPADRLAAAHDRRAARAGPDLPAPLQHVPARCGWPP